MFAKHLHAVSLAFCESKSALKQVCGTETGTVS